ncbi:hypothetical protein L596_001113 [Steinernema carpocapsae]|uniref:Uncharacterized protein n=1 Tax=Steinernema carpocapsae TaxID=34508 RepID=A0A4U8UKU8_STECR|nr:hypothetical protein L596_001113 [Steinernema carpocapsae]
MSSFDLRTLASSLQDASLKKRVSAIDFLAQDFIPANRSSAFLDLLDELMQISPEHFSAFERGIIVKTTTFLLTQIPPGESAFPNEAAFTAVFGSFMDVLDLAVQQNHELISNIDNFPEDFIIQDENEYFEGSMESLSDTSMHEYPGEEFDLPLPAQETNAEPQQRTEVDLVETIIWKADDQIGFRELLEKDFESAYAKFLQELELANRDIAHIKACKDFPEDWSVQDKNENLEESLKTVSNEDLHFHEEWDEVDDTRRADIISSTSRVPTSVLRRLSRTKHWTSSCSNF